MLAVRERLRVTKTGHVVPSFKQANDEAAKQPTESFETMLQGQIAQRDTKARGLAVAVAVAKQLFLQLPYQREGALTLACHTCRSCYSSARDRVPRPRPQPERLETPLSSCTLTSAPAT